MAEPMRLAAATTWFTDPRTPERRMKVASHPEAGVVVLSFWAADRCTATFRLPIDRAPDLMHLLVDAIAEQRWTPEPLPPVLTVRDRLRRAFRAALRRDSLAPVVPLKRSH
jgi:hypothetical protein